MTQFNQWFKLNHQWVDVGKQVNIGQYECMLYWDVEKRHFRVELEGHGNVGRSQLSADKAIEDAKATLAVKEDITVPINVGDVVLGGKFKNKRITVKNIGKNEKGDITINGKPLMKYRIIPQAVEEGPKGFRSYISEQQNTLVTKEEADGFVSKWKSKLKSYGITHVEFSTHFILDRLNHKRNTPPIKVEELDSVMEGFLRKVSTFKKDVENVKNHTAKKRGFKKQEIPDNEYEFAVSDKASKVNFVFVLKQDRHTKGTAMILPMTIIRKKNFKITKGEHIIV